MSIEKMKVLTEKLERFFSQKQQFYFGSPKNKTKNKNDIYSYYDALLELAYEYPDSKSLEVRYNHIEIFDEGLANDLINDPKTWFLAAKRAISNIDFPLREMNDVQVRVTRLPDILSIPLSKIKNTNMGKFISVTCVVSKTTDTRPRITTAKFQCLRCGTINEVIQSDESDNIDEPFLGCENESCGKKGPYKLLQNECETINTQFMKIQEPLESLRGRQPKFLKVICVDELTDVVNPGDKVIITGILEGKLKTLKNGQKSQYLDYYIFANSISKSEKDFEDIEISPEEEEYFKELSKSSELKSIIISSICPSVYGHEDIKWGLAHQLFGGVKRERIDGTTVRGDIHCLLCGDPGMAKSKFLQYVVKFAVRSIMGSGGAVTAAGIAGAAVKDDFDGRWAIEAGLLTLAGEGGICCLDEMDKMSSTDRSALHQAMEQQYIDVAKAGVIAHMPTVCGILGAANPKYGRFSLYESIASQFNLGYALLSRFDLIYIIKDEIDSNYDMSLAMKVSEDIENEKPIINSECLRKYIAYAKTHCSPLMTPEAKEYIARFYVEIRQSGKKDDVIPITVRFLESVKRLATAHAKMRLSDSIELQDAESAAQLLYQNLLKTGIDPETKQLDSSIIYAGNSTAQLNRIHRVKEIISGLSKQNLTGKYARLDEVIQLCTENGIKDIENILKRMSEKGDVFYPDQENIKLIN